MMEPGNGDGSESSPTPQQGLEFMGSTDLDTSGRKDRRRVSADAVARRAGGAGSEITEDEDIASGDDDDTDGDDASDDLSSCAVSVSSRGSFTQISEEGSASSSVGASSSRGGGAPPAPASAPSPSYTGPFSSAAAATAAAPVIAKQTSGGGGGSNNNQSSGGPAPSLPIDDQKSAAQQGVSSSWKSDWDREEQQHALTKSLARHRQALHDTYKLRDAGKVGGGGGGAGASGSGVLPKGSSTIAESASEYDSDDTAKSEATEKTGMVGGPGIVPKTKPAANDDSSDDDVRSLETNSISSGVNNKTGAAAGTGLSSRVIQPRADVMGARGLMAKHRKKNKGEAKGGFYGAGAKGPAGVAAAASSQANDSDSSSQNQRHIVDPNKNFAFITSAQGGEMEGQEPTSKSAPRGLLRRRNNKRKGEHLNRCTIAQRICVTLCAVSAVVVAITGALLPDSAPGRSIRHNLKVAVSGTDGADTPRVDFAEARSETAAAARNSAAAREEALPTGPREGNRERRDEQLDKKRTADAMLAARGQDNTMLVADHFLNSAAAATASVSSVASQSYSMQSSSQESGAASTRSGRGGDGRGGGRHARLGESSHAIGMGAGGFRNLGLLHSSGQYRGLAHPGSANANVLPQYGGITSPSVLPPLEDYNTKEGISGEGIYIPRDVTRNYADVWDSVTRLDMPLFWRIPRSGGRTVQTILGKCLGAVQASEMGREMEARFFRGKTLTVHTNKEGHKYVNVDTTNMAGLRRAKQLGVVSVEASSPVDVVISPLFHEAAAAFDETHRGRAFAMFRHPVKRIASTYFSLARRNDEDGDEYKYGDGDEATAEKVRGMSILEYVKSDLSGENLVVRSLTQDPDGTITAQHVEVAKEVMRRKILVGITELFEASLVRFERYMGWWDVVADNENVLQCQKETVAASDGRHWRPHINPGTAEFLAIAEKNWADLDLYNYAKTLFQEQASLI